MRRLAFWIASGIGAGFLLGSAVVAVVGPPGASPWSFPVGLVLVLGAASLIYGSGSSRRRSTQTSRRERSLPAGLVVAATVVAALAAGAGVVAPYGAGVRQTAVALSKGELHADLRDPEPLAEAMSALRSEIGHDQLVGAVVYRDYVIVEAPVAPGEQAADSWVYRRGTVKHDGAATIQPKSSREAFSYDDVAWAALQPAMNRASEQAGIEDADEVSFTVARTSDSDVDSASFGGDVGPVGVSFSVSNDYQSISFRMRADGSGFEQLTD
ncbi:hypothetical protein ACFWHR_09580 [Leucobacter sp. NPDC058333]|uniref:hypothetical protein n=1 Tax=Leucobacter sp. NPDC058333 TaxID=3346450 RepID=UPI0036536469